MSFVDLFMNEQVSEEEKRRIAEAVREACLRAAQENYELAGLSGLCEEGRWEMVVDALRSLDVEAVLQQFAKQSKAESEIGR